MKFQADSWGDIACGYTDWAAAGSAQFHEYSLLQVPSVRAQPAWGIIGHPRAAIFQI